MSKGRYTPPGTGHKGTEKGTVPLLTLTKETIFIAYAHPGEVPGPFHESLLQVMLEDRNQDFRIVAHMAITSGPRIASARNMMVDTFLNHPARPDWLWMVDSDMVFDHSTMERLLIYANPDTRPILGGLCFGGRRNTIFPTLYRLVDPATNDGEPIQIITDFPDDAIVKVDATGAACLFMHRSALEKIGKAFPAPAQWFSESVYKGLEFGEDWTFCLRAARVGLPIHVHTGIHVGHVKPRIIGVEDFRASREFAFPAKS